jgi:hypothetical protein
MVAEVTPNYDSQWAAINAVAQKLGGGTAETVRGPGDPPRTSDHTSADELGRPPFDEEISHSALGLSGCAVDSLR